MIRRPFSKRKKRRRRKKRKGSESRRSEGFDIERKIGRASIAKDVLIWNSLIRIPSFHRFLRCVYSLIAFLRSFLPQRRPNEISFNWDSQPPRATRSARNFFTTVFLANFNYLFGFYKLQVEYVYIYIYTCKNLEMVNSANLIVDRNQIHRLFPRI